ncbi:MAG: hypothetical protein E6G07_05560 [Actinobacteria bacterium]|nr:MAG: hypothetical protein E6G07_05560 [Actinomycetota bacterium]
MPVRRRSQVAARLITAAAIGLAVLIVAFLLFGAGRTVLSALLPVLPRVMREFPPARSADKRVRRLAAAA